MGKPAAKKGDKIVSATPGDIHIVMVPSPGGPIPTPLPHPCKSDLKMKLAKKVNVQGKPGAMKGSKSKHMPPHIPTPPGVSFQKPPKNEAEVFTASTNVNYEGRGAAMLGDTGLMCSDPTDTPVGVLVVPPGTVYVGGGMTGLEAARAKAKIAALNAAAAACHEWINTHMPLGAAREEAHRRVCEATGHPVDVASGKVFTGVSILTLPGRIPIRLAIDYSTARAQEDGPFGHGWRHDLERHLLITDEFIGYRNQDGHFTAFEPIGANEESQNPGDALILYHHGHYLAVRNADGLEDLFLLPEQKQKGMMLPLAGTRDGYCNSVRLYYDDRRLARIADSFGREVQLTYNDADRVTQVLLKDDPRVAARPVLNCRYDRNGDLVTLADPLGHERHFAYDHHLLVRETDRNGYSFYFAYDEEQRCILTWGDGGKLYRRISYDPERELSHVIDSCGGQTLHRLSAVGTVESTIDPLGREWSKIYDESGLLLSETDPSGRSWTFAYDEAGRLVERSDPFGNSCEQAYDDAGRLASAKYSQGAEISIDYDPRTGKPVAKKIGQDGPEQHFRRDKNGDLEEVLQDDIPILRFRYTDLGLVEEIDAARFRIRRVFDSASHLVEMLDPDGNTSVFTYDVRGEVTTEQRARESLRQFVYDPETNPKRVDQGDRFVGYDYGVLDMPTAAYGNGLRQDLSFGYDTENRLAAVANGRGAQHRFTYDPCGRLAVRHYPDGATIHFDYGVDDQPKRIVDRAGLEISLTHDDFGNCTKAVYADTETTWEFENGGDLVAHETPSVRCEVEQNDAGAPIGENFTFDDGTRLSVLCDEEGFLTVDDDLFRTAAIVDREGQPLGTHCDLWPEPLRYRARSDNVKVRYPNGVIENIKLDSRGRRREQIVMGPDRRLINRRRLIYDDAGRLIGVDDRLKGDRRFSFDLAGRLRAVERPNADQIERYDYDDAENLSRAGESWQFDLGDRLIKRPGHAYTYDASGNCTEHRDQRLGRTRFTYSADGRLVRVEGPGAEGAEYAYDARGRRVRKRVGDVETLYLWNGDLLVAERVSGGKHRTYLYHWRSHHLIGWIDSHDEEMNSYFVHSDHLGRPEEVTDQHGRLVWAVEYGAFGDIQRVLVAEVECPFRSPGQYADPETGLYYNRSRYFDPATGRYMSEDLTGLSGGINPYAYCPNPYADVDFYGEQWMRNPNYDPEAARQELQLMQDIYEQSPALQLAYSPDFDPNNPEHMRRLEEMFVQETGIPLQDWTMSFQFRDRNGVLRTREAGRSSSGHRPDAGAVQWDATRGGPRVLITPNDPRTGEPLTGERRRSILVHEYNSVKLVQAQWPSEGMTPDTRAARELQRPTQFSNVTWDHRGQPAAAGPVYNTHMMDNYAASPEGIENFYAEQDEDYWENEPTQEFEPVGSDE